MLQPKPVQLIAANSIFLIILTTLKCTVFKTWVHLVAGTDSSTPRMTHRMRWERSSHRN